MPPVGFENFGAAGEKSTYVITDAIPLLASLGYLACSYLTGVASTPHHLPFTFQIFNLPTLLIHTSLLLHYPKPARWLSQ